jgi:exosome complex component RRP41
MTPRDGNITLLQMDGEISKDELVKAIELGKEACMKIFELQKKALKENYK